MEVGDSLDVIVTTTAINPSFQWFLNDVVIPDANINTYEATQIGDYKIVISQTSGCLTSNELLANEKGIAQIHLEKESKKSFYW